MSKVYALNFKESEEGLFDWIRITPNADELIKGFIKEKMNENKYNITSINDILDDLFEDDSFWG